MSRLTLIAVVLAILQVSVPQEAQADPTSSATCVIGSLGGSLLCGGVYVIQTPGTRPRGHRRVSKPPAPPAPSGPNGSCVTPAPGSGGYQPTPGLAACPLDFSFSALPLPATNPATLAISFWRRIPLPVPRPQVPPGYAITGLPAYLVTNGILHPAPYAENTPLGPLTIVATGSYFVDWGDGTAPTWAGPYGQEGGPYPNGDIVHTYDNAGVVTVTLDENWSADWTIGPFHGVLPDLRTVATIRDFRVSQLQAVITN
jgi:hypothetical protein